MWEVMSYGERPYWNWSNQDVIKSIEKVTQTFTTVFYEIADIFWPLSICFIELHFPKEKLFRFFLYIVSFLSINNYYL